ncbi:UDP-glycosyltransferase 91A1-like isoform X2 [Momordica charantia]|uniref:UDP-glycosyltransferase 91A1-like isoform X2 n=1 Tax=Momordica charantia TaxID=3673 RepID=A0A6J1C4A3_MOMCH|nr:UDP-glycosyltransferase 91A1-like isoform X2 [Momordica charantia]
MAGESETLRIAMFPWLALGHLIPYLEFAKLIGGQRHHVFFVSTPQNIRRLIPRVPSDLVPFITFVNLPLPPVAGLPDGAEATADLPSHLVKFLKVSYDELRHPMAEFLRSSSPDWILHDFASYWLSPIARQLRIKIGFMGPVSGMKGGEGIRKTPHDFTVTPTWIPFPTTVSFSYYDIKKILDKSSENASGSDNGVSDVHRFADVIQDSDVIAVRGSREFESEWFQVLNEIYQKPVFPAGHFPTTEHDQGEETETWEFIKNWLDNQNRGSVVYVAFGTEAKPTKSELTEIALGLEQSELPFFWALKTRRGAADGEAVQLPEGFEDRIGGRGLVFRNWVPQVKILGHESVGGFLSHGGWSSVVEGIKNGKPLILVGFYGDQGINTKVVAEKKMGLPIPRAEQDGWFGRNSVAESLRMVMVEEQGKIYREKIMEARALFVDTEIQQKYVVEFLEYLKNNKHSCHG